MDLSLFMLDRSSAKTFRFNEYVDVKPGGSITLGFLYVTTVVKDLFGNGLDFVMGLPEIVVRLNRNAEYRIEMPTVERITWTTCADCSVKVSDKAPFCTHCGAALNPTEAALRRAPVYDAYYFPGNRNTRDALTARIFEIPEVQVAMEHAVEAVEAKVAAARAAAGLETPAPLETPTTVPVLSPGAANAMERLRARAAAA